MDKNFQSGTFSKRKFKRKEGTFFSKYYYLLKIIDHIFFFKLKFIFQLLTQTTIFNFRASWLRLYTSITTTYILFFLCPIFRPLSSNFVDRSEPVIWYKKTIFSTRKIQFNWEDYVQFCRIHLQPVSILSDKIIFLLNLQSIMFLELAWSFRPN